MQGKVFINAAKARNEVILERANGSFGSVAAMNARRDELVVNFLVDDELFKDGRTFVVQSLEFGAQASSDETGVENFVSGQDARAGATAERLNNDAVAVVVVQHENVIVTGAGSHDESSSLVGMDLATGWFDDAGETLVSAFVSVVARGEAVEVIGDGGGVDSLVFWLGGLLIFAGLIHVSFDHGHGMGRRLR